MTRFSWCLASRNATRAWMDAVAINNMEIGNVLRH